VTPSLSRASFRHRALLAAVPAVLVVAVFVAHARLVYSLNVNWDELNFLAKIHSHGRGELVGRLLTFHVHFLGWARDASPNEILQVLHLRDAMLALNVVTAVATFFIGRRLIGSVAAALFAVFAGQSFSLVLNHGTSARYDPIVVCLFLVSAALLVCGGRRTAPIAGLVTALCLLISIKSVFYLPTLAGLIACRVAWDDDRRGAMTIAVSFALSTVVSFVALFALHAASLSGVHAASAAPVADQVDALGSIAAKAFFPPTPVSRGVFLDSLRWDGVFWALLVAGAVIAVVSLRTRPARLHNVQLLCFALPLASLLVYRSSFAYFYVSIIPPAALLAGVLVGRIEQRFAMRTALAVALVAVTAAPLARSAFLWCTYNSDDQTSSQKLLVDVVHATFPDPVPYVDRCGMISSFRKVGPFMSTWTLSDYRERGTPIMRELLQRERPQFLLENISSLGLSQRYGKGKRYYRLLRQDFDALAESFIPHWGPLWVAGKILALTPQAPTDFDLLIAGRYVVEGDYAITLDGTPTIPGEAVDLARGRHRIGSTASQEIRLRIGSARPPPATAAPLPQEIFRGFRYRRVAVDDDEQEP
jgi:hypothetical protein